VTTGGWPQTVGVPARILVVGDDLLAGALATALTAHGFSTMLVPQREPKIGRGIGWRPSLVIVDAGSVEPAVGAALVGTFRRVGLGVCVIDGADEASRPAVWKRLGAAAVIDTSAPFEELFRTVNRLLWPGSPVHSVRQTSASLASRPAAASSDPALESFAVLTEREKFVLAELIEGHCAEEIARNAVVSISTVRSQIKSILQKLGVSSQLAAVALARRAAWSHEKSSVSGDPATRRASAI
jgi:two-component system, NarL family, nitrate/nitrite response regulator NarL